jgi:hypothetical protein
VVRPKRTKKNNVNITGRRKLGTARRNYKGTIVTQTSGGVVLKSEEEKLVILSPPPSLPPLNPYIHKWKISDTILSEVMKYTATTEQGVPRITLSDFTENIQGKIFYVSHQGSHMRSRITIHRRYQMDIHPPPPPKNTI